MRSELERLSGAPVSGEILRRPMSDTLADLGRIIDTMVGYVREFSGDPLVVSTTRKVLSACDAKDRTCEIASIFEWNRYYVRYVNDPVSKEVMETPPRLIRDAQQPPHVLEAILPPDLRTAILGFGPVPDVISRARVVTRTAAVRHVKDGVGVTVRAAEDCESQSALLASMLASVGIVPRFRLGGEVLRVSGKDECNFHHVWVQALDGSGTWVDLDSTEKEKMGWFYPHFACYGTREIF